MLTFVDLGRNYKHQGLTLSYLIFIVNFLKRESLAYENIYKAELNVKGLNLTGRYILKKLKVMIDESEEDAAPSFQSNTAKRPEAKHHRNKVKIPKAMKQKLTEQIYKHLQKTCSEFSYLWQAVSEDNLTMAKINSSVKDSNKSIEDCFGFWKKNFTYFKQMPQIKQIFGRFLKDVLDQHDKGVELINESFQSLKKKSQEKLLLKNINYLTNIENFVVPSFTIIRSQIVR